MLTFVLKTSLKFPVLAPYRLVSNDHKYTCKAEHFSLHNDRTLVMTHTNWFKDVFDIRQWYLLIVFWNCIKTNASCPSGTFKSDFLSGGCALCPQKLKYCENEELEDSVRCFKACRKLHDVI